MNAKLMLGALAMLLSAIVAEAQTFPDRAVKLVVPFSAGGSNDLIGRYLADGLSKKWGQPVVVENQPGAGTAIGSANVAQSAPDGYTILIVSGTITANAAVQKNQDFNPETDLVPVAIVARTPVVILAGPKLEAATMQEFLTLAKTREIMHGSSGVGSLPHFGSELLAAEAGLMMTQVQYQGGSGEMQQDLLGGRIDIVFANMPFALGNIGTEGVRALAITGGSRVPQLPDAPTLKELGLESADYTSWWGVFAPTGTPEDVVQTMNAAIGEVMSTPEARSFLEENGATPDSVSPAEFRDFLVEEYARWREVAETRGIAAN